MTISFHLEYKLAYSAETKAAVPPCIDQNVICLAIMCVPCLACLISVDRSSPTFVVLVKLKRVKIIFQLEMKN
ncbi:hypothetical protein OIU74_022863 [Salix koriyanagi]|uniref:Uncharacterized protein n=1 Tax=Salix koriyanagi TaxID=2511006 RepID=A0A9Q0WL47_9ROSI|nr:hypothetical protein OIU74_022863 [Salix koriyanagi]